MATYTQENQPYGSLVRREYLIDGIRYVVRRSEIHQGKRRWQLLRGVGEGYGLQVDAWCDLALDKRLEDATKRLLGRGKY